MKKKKAKKPVVINNSNQLNQLIAEDLFEEERLQVFNAKSGEWLGSVKKGEQIPELFAPEDPQQEKEIINPNQIKMF